MDLAAPPLPSPPPPGGRGPNGTDGVAEGRMARSAETRWLAFVLPPPRATPSAPRFGDPGAGERVGERGKHPHGLPFEMCQSRISRPNTIRWLASRSNIWRRAETMFSRVCARCPNRLSRSYPAT